MQTERKAHEAWDLLIKKHSAAARVMHRLVSLMDKKGAVVISQKTLGELLGLHRNSVGRAVKTLESDNWIEVIKLGAESGGVRGYRVNRRVAWADKRSNQRFAEFDARVIVSASEQGRDVDQSLPDLRHIPIAGETQSIAGDGMKSPSQPALIEPDLPAIEGDAHLQEQLELN